MGIAGFGGIAAPVGGRDGTCGGMVARRERASVRQGERSVSGKERWDRREVIGKDERVADDAALVAGWKSVAGNTEGSVDERDDNVGSDAGRQDAGVAGGLA